VKLDRHLVHGIDRDLSRQALLAGMHHFARATGCELAGEGIETAAERDTLQVLGVRYGQGYLLGRPAPAKYARRRKRLDSKRLEGPRSIAVAPSSRHRRTDAS
jgi:EAL domain-containing protein (putative c-di-GMP-specific phosphodiesterase class I)